MHQLYRRVRRERTFRHHHLRGRRHRHPVVRSLRIYHPSTTIKCRSWRCWSPGRGNGRTGPAWWRRLRAARSLSMSSVTIGAHPWSKGWTRSQLIQQVIVEPSSILVECLRGRIFPLCRKCLIFKKRNRRREKDCVSRGAFPFPPLFFFHAIVWRDVGNVVQSIGCASKNFD